MAEGKIDVLDHGYARLVDHMGGDLSIVRAARVSHNADWRAGENEGSDKRLINYLWRNEHTTPFEAVQFTFEIKAPIFVVRQWHRHRTWSYNEVSARYTELPEEYYIPKIEDVGVQSKNNKQARDLVLPEGLATQRATEIAMLRKACEADFKLYHSLIESGWPRELARMKLPFNTYTRMFGSVNLHNLLRFIALRTHEHAQYEIRVYAEALKELARLIAPVAIEAFEKEGGEWVRKQMQLPGAA